MATFWTQTNTPSSDSSKPNNAKGYAVGRIETVVDSNNGNRLVCPVISSMNMTESATAETSTLEEKKVVISGIDEIFQYTTTASDAAALLNAFDVSGYGDLLTVSMDVNGADAFKTLLKRAINFGTIEVSDASGHAVGTDTAIDFLNDGLKNDLQTLIGNYFNAMNVAGAATLVNTVKYKITGFSQQTVVLDASGGAAQMWSDLSNNSDDLLNIYLQIPQATLNSYKDGSDNPTTAALPLNNNDSLTFVFDVLPSAVVFTQGDNNSTKVKGPMHGVVNLVNDLSYNDISVNLVDAGNSGDYDIVAGSNMSLNWTPNSRRLAFEVTVGNLDAADLKAGYYVPSTYNNQVRASGPNVTAPGA